MELRSEPRLQIRFPHTLDARSFGTLQRRIVHQGRMPWSLRVRKGNIPAAGGLSWQTRGRRLVVGNVAEDALPVLDEYCLPSGS